MGALLYRSGRVGRRAAGALMVIACFAVLDGGPAWTHAAEPLGGERLSRGPDTSCTTCHTFDATLSHPVGVAPAMPVPAGLPLLDGRIACTTCHDEAEHDAGTSRGGGMLRGGQGVTELCAACHAEGEGRRDAHGRGLRRAHLVSSRVAGVAEGRAVDSESASCMGCHDGAAATDAGNHRVRGAGGAPGDHPIGSSMELRSAEREELLLRKLREVDSRVRLFAGTVGCGSCHSVYSRRDKLLVMNNAGSALCLSCHVQ